MISQSLYQVLCEKSILRHIKNPKIEEQFSRFKRPYILVIHRPSGRGFYLDREYRHILDVKNCQEPKKPAEVERHHLCASPDLPAWVWPEFAAFGEEFDSFWLY